MILFAFKEMHFGGGAEKNLIEVALHVAKRHRVGFYISGGYVDPRIKAAGPVFVMPGGGRFWAAPLDLLHLGWVVLRHRVRLMHAHHRYPAFMASLLRKLIPFRLLGTVHNRFPNRAKASLWGDRALAVSEDIAQWLRNEAGTPEALIRVVHNGIADPARSTPAELQQLLDECGVAEDEVVMCAVGRLAAQKNFSLLFDALALVQHSRWRLLLVGEGEERQALEARARGLGIGGRVRFLGKRNDVPRIMQASAFMVMSSSWEGFPYVVVEALANSLPVVATDVGGVREGVISGVTGMLVEPGNAVALAEAIEAMLVDGASRQQWAAAGRALFEKRFRIEAMLSAIDEEIKALLKPAR
jgi:glycosyltransferase involved in cell wall biosynthesis